MSVNPGWYKSPDGSPVMRWWDGRQWTEQTAPQQSRVQQWAERSAQRVMITKVDYLGGLPGTRPRKTGTLHFREDVCGWGVTGPKYVTLRPEQLAAVEVSGGEVAKRRLVAVAALGVLGLAARGAKDQSVIVLHVKDGNAAYFEVDKTTPQSIRGALSEWMTNHHVPWHEAPTT